MVIEWFKKKVRFDRNEFAGSFGDIGTDFPLIVSLILICGLDPASVLVMFGVMQILTGVTYGIPMPVQPLKAMAAIMITQKLGGDILHGAGLVIGVLMIILSLTGLLHWIGRIVPACVVRGIQFGLGIQLSLLALKEYVPAQGIPGYFLAFVSFVLIIALWGNRKYPAALFVIAFGLLYAVVVRLDPALLWQGVGLQVPQLHVPQKQDMINGFLLLALPQLSLSIGNSILATKQFVADYFPDRQLSIRKIGLTYGIMNLISPFFSGIPVCHGSGGIAGHYTFGARTGGSVVIYGTIYLILGLFFSGAFGSVIELFPKPVLGIILFFEGMVLVKWIKDTMGSSTDLLIAVMVGLMAVGLPYGYLVGLISGTLLKFLSTKRFVNIQ
jgi:hypothetical protein